MLSALFQSRPRVALSFELFPPKTEKGEQALYRHVERLMKFRPDFVTCTYGAGGSTRAKTLEIVEQVKQKFSVPVASHLTLVGSNVTELRQFLSEAQQRGVDAIVALRGDPPAGETQFQQAAGGLQYANELVELIAAEFPEFGVAVAGYPEKHREASSLDFDLENLKRKVDAGADVILTQLFYDNEDFFRFQDHCQRLAIDVPLVPGILPITNLKQVQRITALCGARLPERLVQRLGERDDPEWQFQVGLEHAREQTEGLLSADVPGLHYYVLNKSDATAQILESLGEGRLAVPQA